MYHTREAFNTRLANRRSLDVLPLPHQVYYHVSLMPGWEPIVGEQLALLTHIGLRNCRSFVIATPGPDFHRFQQLAEKNSVTVDVIGVTDDFSKAEGLTLNALYNWAKDNPSASVLYFHTKGASAPQCPHKRHWRRAMMRHMVAEWEHNLKKLAVDDLVGCAWQPDPHYPHFCGNFWAARCDWLTHLQHPDDYRFGRADFRWAGTPHSWQRRIYVETWIGSKPFHSVHDRVSVGYPLWSEAVYEVNYNVPGFSYNKEFCLSSGNKPITTIHDLAESTELGHSRWQELNRTNLVVLSREQIETESLPNPCALLSFIDSPEQRPSIRDSSHIQNLLEIVCNDARESHGLVRAPDRAQAERILDFIFQSIRHANIILQCERGIGRSRATLAALEHLRGNCPDSILALGTHNPVLYRLLCDAGGKPLPPEPLISIAARVKYRSDRLLSLILSMQRQRHENWELIVVTDGPDSGAIGLVDSFRAQGEARIKVIETPRPLGRWGHPYRQLGIDACRGDYYGLTNDDNYYVPGYLEQMLAALKDADLAFCHMLHSYQGWGYVPVTKVQRGYIDLGCFLARRELADRVKWEGDDQFADGRYLEALASAARRIVEVPRPLFIHN